MSRDSPIDPLSATMDQPAGTDPSPADERIGKLYGEYRLVRRIGKGGMGSVYAAEHIRLGRIAAIKVMSGQLTSDPKSLQRFKAEALTVARLQHTNVVDVYDVGDTPEPHCVMELLSGSSLAALLERSSALPEGRLLYIAAQVLGVLDVVHSRGIVHRDIKPDNIFLVEDVVRADHVKLLDFGVAKIRDAQSMGLSSTGSAMVGTPMYMSPEQIDGREIDARTDLYALGLVMYEMATGRPAFAATTLTSLLSKQLIEVPPAVRSLNPAISTRLEEVIARCLAKSPDQRFASAAEVLSALDLTSARSLDPRAPKEAPRSGEVGHLATMAAPASQPTRPFAWRRLALIGLLGIAAVAVTAFLVGGHPPAPPKDASPQPKEAATKLPPAAPPEANGGELLTRANVLLGVGDATGALALGRQAIAKGIGREGWMLVARSACMVDAKADLKEAIGHLSAGDQAAATRGCAPARHAARPKRPSESDHPASPKEEPTLAPGRVQPPSDSLTKSPFGN